MRTCNPKLGLSLSPTLSAMLLTPWLDAKSVHVLSGALGHEKETNIRLLFSVALMSPVCYCPLGCDVEATRAHANGKVKER